MNILILESLSHSNIGFDMLVKCIVLYRISIRLRSQWAPWRHKLPASRLFNQPFVQAQIKESSKAPRHWIFVRGIQRWPANLPHTGLVTRNIFPFDDVIMQIFHISSPWYSVVPKVARMPYVVCGYKISLKPLTLYDENTRSKMQTFSFWSPYSLISMFLDQNLFWITLQLNLIGLN